MVSTSGGLTVRAGREKLTWKTSSRSFAGSHRLVGRASLAAMLNLPVNVHPTAEPIESGIGSDLEVAAAMQWAAGNRAVWIELPEEIAAIFRSVSQTEDSTEPGDATEGDDV